MNAAKKLSRNARRKAEYAAQADKSSRNQDMLAGPVVGRFVEETAMVACPKCVPRDVGYVESAHYLVDDCKRCNGHRKIPKTDRDGNKITRTVIDHGETKTAAAPDRQRRPTDARKRRRQIAAWGRCIRRTGAAKHDYSDGRANCRSCGCPASVAA